MPKKKTSEREHKEYHKDGTPWAKGRIADGVPVGYWEWFRKDGTRLRSGHFEKGAQIGEWISYDKNGAVYKGSHIKAKIKKTAVRPSECHRPRNESPSPNYSTPSPDPLRPRQSRGTF